MTRESWAQEKRTRKEEKICICPCFGGTPQKSLSCPVHGDGRPESSNPGADSDILEWYAAAAEARNK